MVALFSIALSGFLCSLIIHIAATAKYAWVGDNLNVLLGMLFSLGLIMMLITIIQAWEWPLIGLFENYMDGMSANAKSLVSLAVLYPFIIGGIGRYKGMPLVEITTLRSIWEATAVIIPLFLLPACYFWKERPLPSNRHHR